MSNAFLIFSYSVFKQPIFNVPALYIMRAKAWLSQVSKLCANARMRMAGGCGNRIKRVPLTIFHECIYIGDLSGEPGLVALGFIFRPVKT